MALGVRDCATGIAIAAGLFGVLPSAAAEPAEPLTILLVAVDHAQVPEQVLTRAKAEAARIYRSAGIKLVWSDTLDFSVPQMILNIVSKPTGARLTIPGSLAVKAADSRVLGVAPGHKNRRDLAVWAFYERILDVATILGVDPGLLLGHVIAHEMGHLLLPYDAHSQTGLMRAGWDKFQAANAVVGNLKFNPGESGLIRRSVAKMAAGGPSSRVSSSPTPRVPQPEDLSSPDRPRAAR
jgi:hypothetical protein